MDDPRPVHILQGLTVSGALAAATLVTTGLALFASAQIQGTATIGTSLVVTGPVTGSSFSGSGTSLTGLNASNLGSGTVPLSRLGISGTPGAATFFRGDNSWAQAVTAVTVINANGVSASVANQGTTPAFTFTLGDITPVSVAATGDLSAGGTVFSVGGFIGPGAQIVALNADNIGSGTVPLARLGTGTPDNTKFHRGDNAWATAVTAVTIVAANGVSGSVATQGTTPAITLTLGAITPSSVAATGAVSGSTLSGAGSAITALNASNLASGTVPIARLGSTGTASVTTFLAGNNAWATAVTAVTVVTANGVSATVATQGTTPAFTFTLGAITPSSVAATGNVGGATLSSTGLATLNSASITGSASVGGGFTVTGSAQFGTLSSSGLASLQSVTTVNGVNVGGALAVTGVATADSFIATGNTVPTVGIYEGASAGGISIATNNTDRFSITSGGQMKITASIVEAVNALTSSAVDCSKGNYFTRTNSAASTWTFTNVPTGFYRFTLRIIRASGAGSQTWPSSVRWTGGTAPTLTTTNGGSDIMEFLTDNAGVTWRAYRIIQTTS